MQLVFHRVKVLKTKWISFDQQQLGARAAFQVRLDRNPVLILLCNTGPQPGQAGKSFWSIMQSDKSTQTVREKKSSKTKN